MAYGKKYYTSFTDLMGAAWSISFYFDGFTGSATFLSPANSPLTFTKGEDSEDKTTAIIGTQADITMLAMSAADIAIIQDFFTTQDYSIRVIIKQTIGTNQSFVFIGHVMSNNCGYTLGNYPYEFQVSATDGIGLLKGINVDIADLINSTNGYVPILRLLMDKGLWRSCNGVISVLNVMSTLEAGTAITTLDGLYLYYSYFYDSSFNPLDLYTILSGIASAFRCRLLQSDGYFYFQRIADLSNESLTTANQYSVIGGTSSPVTIDLVKKLGGDNADLLYASNYAQVSIFPPYLSYNVDMNYLIKNPILNGDFTEYTNSQFNYWFATNWGLISQIGLGQGNSPYLCQFKGSGGADYLAQWILYDSVLLEDLNLKIDLTNCDHAAWQFHAYKNTQTLNTPHKVLVNGAWIDSTTALPGDASYNNNITQASGVYTNQIALLTGLLSSDYDNLLLMFISPTGATGNYMNIYPLTADVVPQNYSGQTIKATTTKKWSSKITDGNFNIADDQLSFANALYYGHYQANGDRQWKANEFNFSLGSFQALQAYSIMAQNSFPYEVMRGTFYGNNIKLHQIIKRDYDNKLFMQLYDSYEVKTCLHSMTLAEIRNVGVSAADFTVDIENKLGGFKI